MVNSWYYINRYWLYDCCLCNELPHIYFRSWCLYWHWGWYIYGIPVQIIQTVYEKNQGLAVGLTIAGFGLSTVIVAPILQLSFDSVGFQNTLTYFGIVSTGTSIHIRMVTYKKIRSIKTICKK